ncbi:MAG TPA: tetratricopeptide repeat protein [Pirellulales bacterium]|nr:tetratricopeptide repeat protein [Pirellulales bacterium]
MPSIDCTIRRAPPRRSRTRLGAAVSGGLAWGWFALVLPWLFVSPVRAADLNASRSSNKQIDALITQLGSKNFFERQKAQAELLKIGAPAIDALNEAANHDDLEIAERARYLIKLVHVDWVSDSDPTLVRERLEGYEDLEIDDRLRRIKGLSLLPNGIGLIALCRLVRLEKTPFLSKQAALAALSIPDPDGAIWTKRAKQSLETLDGSGRPGAVWIRTVIKALDQPEAALAEWEKIVADETAAREQNGPANDFALVALLRREVLLLEKLHRRDQALVVARKQISYERGAPESLIELVTWLTKQQLWELVDEVATKFERPIEQNALLLYTVADARSLQGKTELAEKLASQAFALNREQLLSHLQAAALMQKRGQFTWMEREYRALIQLPPTRYEPMEARLLLSECLHDQGQEKAAAEVLGPIVAPTRANQQIQQVLKTLDRNPSSIAARMHYFQARAYEADHKSAEALRELNKALAQDDTDADVLIALFRLTKDKEADHKKVVQRVNETLDSYRSMIQNAPNDAMAYNQLAWLLAGTHASPDEAISASQKSLELRPGEAGYLDTLGHCYFAKGDYENAILYQTQAIELDPHSGQLKAGLAEFKAAQAKAADSGKHPSEDSGESPGKSSDKGADKTENAETPGAKASAPSAHTGGNPAPSEQAPPDAKSSEKRGDRASQNASGV